LTALLRVSTSYILDMGFNMRFAITLIMASLAAAPALAEPAETVATPVVAKFTVDTPIETLMADPVAKAVVEANLPGMSTHMMYDQFKSLSLAALAPMSAGKISEQALAKITEGLAAIK
jgi:hypothetical protein